MDQKKKGFGVPGSVSPIPFGKPTVAISVSWAIRSKIKKN